MKKTLTVILSLSLWLMCACGPGPGNEPSVSAAPAATEIPAAPETTPEPEAPGAGRVLIHIKQSRSMSVPVVSITGREPAAAAINDALASVAHNAYRIVRSDNRVLSLLCGDALAEDGQMVWRALNFDTLTGEMLRFSDLSPDREMLESACAAFLSSGPAGDVPDDGWYLAGEGLALLTENGAAGQPVIVPYGALTGILYDAWIPPEQEPVSGTLAAAYSADTDMSPLTLLDEVTVSGGMESVILRAEGNVRDVAVFPVTTIDGTNFIPDNTLWSCSMLRDGEAVRLNVTVPEGLPDLMIRWLTDSDSCSALLSRNGETGGVHLVSLSGEVIAAPGDGPYAHITPDALLGYWSNDGVGAKSQSVSFASASVCYLWHSGLGYNGDGFLWELVYRDDACPQIVIHTSSGDLRYDAEELEGDTLRTGENGIFTRAEAVG